MLKFCEIRAEKLVTSLQAENKDLKAKTSNSTAAAGPVVAALEERVALLVNELEATHAGWAKAHAHSETQALDIEMLKAQTTYDEARLENLDITVAEQALELASAEKRNIDLEVELEEVKHALQVAQKAVEEVQSGLSEANEVDADDDDGDDGADDDCDDEVNDDHEEVDVEDNDDDDDDDDDDGDDDDGDEKPWLVAIEDETVEDVRRTFEVNEDEVVVLNAAEWTGFDTFVTSIVPLLTRAERDDPNATTTCISQASAFGSFSQAFWQMCCDKLIKVSEHCTVVIVDMPKEEEEEGTTADVPGVPSRDELLRMLVCVVYEAYSLAECADKFVVALRGISPGNLGAEDPTGNAANPSFHHVAALEELDEDVDDDDDVDDDVGGQADDEV
jgi:hypothetical protein